MKRVLLLILLLTGCAQLPPTAADIQAKKFEAVPDKAVIYVVRPPVDSLNPGVLMLDTGEQISTMSGTYHRTEVTPGVRRIDGDIPLSPSLTIKVEAGKIYFLRYTVLGFRGPLTAFLQRISEQQGRELVEQAELFP